MPVVTPDTKKVVSNHQKAATPPVPPVPTVPAKPTEPVKESKLTEPAKAEVPAAPKPEKIDLSKVNYSGLIIDAREVEVKPALMPKVLNEKGRLFTALPTCRRRRQ